MNIQTIQTSKFGNSCNLTGNIRLRSSISGKVIVQVEYRFIEGRMPDTSETAYGWRDAKISDLVWDRS